MAISDFGNELLVTNQSGVTYDLNKDYSKAIAAAKAAGQDTALLEAQRQAKMNSAAYGGAYKTGAESSSLGSVYNENATISNRTSNASPIIVNSTIQEMADPLSNTAEYLKQMYANNTAAELAALKSTYEQNVADNEANIPKINEMYQAARNETAAQSEIDKRNFAEYAVANALNTGTSGQAELARQVSLTGNLAGISGQEKNTLAENELQKQQLTIAYRNAIDEAAAQGNAALAQALYAEYVRQIEANTAQGNLDREYASNMAYAMLQAGITPNASTLAAAGISPTDANALAAYYKQLALQEAGIKTTTSSSSSSSSSKSSTESGSGYDNSGIDKEDIIKMQKALGVTPDGLWGAESQNAAKAAGWGTNANEAWKSFSKYPDVEIQGKPAAQYDIAASNYKEVRNMAEELYATKGKQAALEIIKEAYETGALNMNDYMSLYNKYRNK